MDIRVVADFGNRSTYDNKLALPYGIFFGYILVTTSSHSQQVKHTIVLNASHWASLNPHICHVAGTFKLRYTTTVESSQTRLTLHENTTISWFQSSGADELAKEKLNSAFLRRTMRKRKWLFLWDSKAEKRTPEILGYTSHSDWDQDNALCLFLQMNRSLSIWLMIVEISYAYSVCWYTSNDNGSILVATTYAEKYQQYASLDRDREIEAL